VVGVPVVVAVGGVLPMLGVSLVALLAVDLVAGAAGRRAAWAAPISPVPADVRGPASRP
jgi:hypothetical protein